MDEAAKYSHTQSGNAWWFVVLFFLLAIAGEFVTAMFFNEFD